MNPGREVYLIEDMAPCHQKCQRMCKEERAELGIVNVIWCANSPDMNKIEGAWDHMKVIVYPKIVMGASEAEVVAHKKRTLEI